MPATNREKAISAEAAELTDMEKTILKARDGDPQAISLLYEQAYSKVYYTVRSMIRDEDAVFDIVQNTFIKAFTHLDQFDGSDRFISWVKQIAVNSTRDWLKKKRPLLFSELPGEEGDTPLEEQIFDDKPENLPEQVLDQGETTRLIREILQELPEDQRAVIGLYYYEEYSVKEIAQLTDTTESAVKSRLLYGRRKIEKKVRELEKQGTKLYNLAPIPFLLWLFRSEKAYAAELPDARIRNRIMEKTAASHSSKASAITGHTGKSGVFLGGTVTMKIGAAAVIAAALIGGSIAGISRSNSKSDIPENTVVSVQEETESVMDSAAEEPETEGKKETFLEIYSELISNAASYDYDCGEAKPTGIYRYAFVTLQEEDEIPALLIAQEANDGMARARVFLYDSASNKVHQPTEILLMGVSQTGGYRGNITTGVGQTQLQITEVSGGTGAVDVSRILVSGSTLIYDHIGSGTLGGEIAGVTCEDIQWLEINDSTGIENDAGFVTDVSERLVLSGMVETMTYDEAVKLQGYPDYNREDPKQTWVIIRLDAPQLLEGTQDISNWKEEHSVILVSNSIRVKMGLQRDVLKDYIGKNIIFSAGSYSKASDTSVPIGIPWAEDIQVLEVINQ